MDPDGRKEEPCTGSRVSCPSGTQGAAQNAPGVRTATAEQRAMVPIESQNHKSPDAAAIAFGTATQQKADDESQEPQSGIVRISANNYGYTKPMWGGKGDKQVSVGAYTQALKAVYGSSAVAFAHGHFDTNMRFSTDDLLSIKTTMYMHNQNGETRKMTAHILRDEVRDGNFRNKAHMLQVKLGADGVCVGGCSK